MSISAKISLFSLAFSIASTAHSQYKLYINLHGTNQKTTLPTAVTLADKELQMNGLRSIDLLDDTLFIYHPHYKIQPLPLLAYPYTLDYDRLTVEASATPFYSHKETIVKSFASSDKIANGKANIQIITDSPKAPKAIFLDRQYKKIARLQLKKIKNQDGYFQTTLKYNQLQDGFLVLQNDTLTISKNDFFQPIYYSPDQSRLDPLQLEFVKKYFSDLHTQQKEFDAQKKRLEAITADQQAKLRQLDDQMFTHQARLNRCRSELCACQTNQPIYYSPLPVPPPVPYEPEEVFLIENDFLSFFRAPQPRQNNWILAMPAPQKPIKRSGEIVLFVELSDGGNPAVSLIYAASEHRAYADALRVYLASLRYSPATLDGQPTQTAFLCHIFITKPDR